MCDACVFQTVHVAMSHIQIPPFKAALEKPHYFFFVGATHIRYVSCIFFLYRKMMDPNKMY
jgi:hypothetical protein